jgi:hypothetical protein
MARGSKNLPTIYMSKQAIKSRKGGRKDTEGDIIITRISLVEKKESKSLRIACPIPPPLPARALRQLLAVALCGRAAGCCSLPLPPGIPSSSRGVDRGTVRSSGWWVGLVWFGESWRERRGRRDRQWRGVAFLAWLAGGLVGLACHETPSLGKDNPRG